MVEFALTLPFLISGVFGAIAAGYVYFDQQSLDDATRSAARAAVVTTALNTTNAGCPGGQGESGTPVTIEGAAQHGATAAVRVDPAPLCTINTTTLGQTPSQPTDVVLTVAGSPDITKPTQITVTASAVVHPFGPELGIQLTLTSQSTLAIPQ